MAVDPRLAWNVILAYEAARDGRACSICNHRSECYVTKYPHLAVHILGPR